MSWLNPTNEDRDYVEKLKQDELSYRLLRVLALALRIEPLLMRNARLHFTPASDIEIETQIWFSSIMHTRNAKACVIRGGIARALVDEWVKDSEDYMAAWTFVQTHTRHWSAQDQLEQELRLNAGKEDSAALHNGFNRILKTLLETKEGATKRDLSRWIKGAMPALLKPEEVDETAHLLFQYTAGALGLPASWSNDLHASKASMPQWLIDALPPGKENSIGIQLRKGVLECLEPDSARHILTFNLPLPAPVLLTVNKNGQAQWQSLWIGRKIPIPHPIQWLTLQTLDGKLYRFINTDKEKGENYPGGAAQLLLVYMPGDFDQAQKIAEILRQQDIDVELAEDQAPQDISFVSEDRPLLRLWSKTSADYWQKSMRESDNAADRVLAKGLLLRTDPDVALPAVANQTRALDFIDWNNPNNVTVSGQLVKIVRDWLSTGELVIPDKINEKPNNDVEALLKELENPETRPRRRLEIGDLLAELGDPRKGVGVKEYELIDYPPEIQRLLDELNEIKTEPPRRLEIGNQLAELGDPRPGVGLDDNGLPDIDWVEIPAGPFIYGKDKNQQTIDLPRYYISRYPITNCQYQAFIDAGGYSDQRWWQDLKKPEPKEPGWTQPNRPRETVDWFEALAFTRWLSAQRGVEITLPTEQQWEKTARGTDGRVFPWGNEYRSGYANINETTQSHGTYYLQETSAVGIYPQGESPYRIDDMAGNVWEWCLNKYHKSKEIDPDQSTDSRVLRGGSLNSYPVYARVSVRDGGNPGGRNVSLGFRVVCSSPYTD